VVVNSDAYNDDRRLEYCAKRKFDENLECKAAKLKTYASYMCSIGKIAAAPISNLTLITLEKGCH